MTELFPQRLLSSERDQLLPKGLSYEEFSIFPKQQLDGTKATSSAGISTSPNSIIEFVVPHEKDCFIDTRTTRLMGKVTVGISNTSGVTINSCNLNGFVLGSFYSQFFSMTTSVNDITLDHVEYLGILAKWLFQLTTDSQRRATNAAMWGLSIDSYGQSCTAAARIFGNYPYVGSNDSSMTATVVPVGNGGLVLQLPTATNTYQVFNFCLPVFGALGQDCKNLFPLWSGDVKLSLATDDPSNFVVMSGGIANCRTSVPQYGTWSATVVTTAANRIACVDMNSWVIWDMRFIGSKVRCSPDIMKRFFSKIINGKYAVRYTSYSYLSGRMPARLSGTVRLPITINRGKAKAILTLFNPDTSKVATVINANYPADEQILRRYSSVNPNLGDRTFVEISGRNYPRNGLNPSEYPSVVLDYNYRGIQALTDSPDYPFIPASNFMVIDYNGMSSTSANAGGIQPLATMVVGLGWRTHLFQHSGTATASNVPAMLLFSAMLPPTRLLGLSGYGGTTNPVLADSNCCSNDFFILFNLQDSTEESLSAGTKLYSTASFLNLNIARASVFPYIIDMFVAYEGIASFDAATAVAYVDM